MEPENLREGVTIPNLNASFLVPEETRQFSKSPTPAPPPVLDMMETILEFDEEDDDSQSSFSTPGHNLSRHFNLTNPLVTSTFQFQSPEPPTTPYSPQSPMDYGNPIAPVNTPTTGHGQIALLQSCQQQLLVTQAAAKLAFTGCAQDVTAGPGLQLLRDSL